MKKASRAGNSLVIEHLEGISRSAINRYPEIITEFVRRKSGVYALYKGDALYYIGLGDQKARSSKKAIIGMPNLKRIPLDG